MMKKALLLYHALGKLRSYVRPLRWTLIPILCVGILIVRANPTLINNWDDNFASLTEVVSTTVSKAISATNTDDKATSTLKVDAVLETDTDGDGVMDEDDLDDDNDGILDVNEGCVGEDVELGVDGSFESLADIASDDAFNSNVTAGGWVNGIGSADSWISPMPTTGTGTWGGLADGTPSSPNGGVFVAGWVQTETNRESFYIDLNDLTVDQTYILKFYQAHAGIEGTTVIGSNARWEVRFGSEIQFSSEMPYLGEGLQVWMEETLTFTATETSARLEFFAEGGTDGVEGLFYDVPAIDGVRLFEATPLCEGQDSDGDGIPDHLDTDSDSDGCPDALEGDGGFSDADIDTSDRLTGNVNADGIPVSASVSGQGLGSSLNADVQTCIVIDTDGDGVADGTDLDDDNDGILDVNEGCIGEDVELGVDGSFESLAAFASDDAFNSNVTAGGWVNGVGSADSWISPMPTTGTGTWGGLADGTPSSPNGGVFVGGWVQSASNRESFYIDLTDLKVDQAYILKFYQTHAGIEGTTVIGSNARWEVHFGSEVQFSTEIPYLGEGLQVWMEETLTFTARETTTRLEFFTDGGTDGVEGILYDAPAIDGVRLFESVTACAGIDTDNDGTPDHLDLDSDGDGCPDAIEGAATFGEAAIDVKDQLIGGVDANGVPLVATASGQGLGSSLDASVDACPIEDNDGDGIPDDIDLDDDNDGILDDNECSLDEFTEVFSLDFESNPYTGADLGNGVVLQGGDMALFNTPVGTGGQLGTPTANGELSNICGEGEDQCEGSYVSYPYSFSCGGAENQSIEGGFGLFLNSCAGEANEDANCNGVNGEAFILANVPLVKGQLYDFRFKIINIFGSTGTYDFSVQIRNSAGTTVRTVSIPVDAATTGEVLTSETLFEIEDTDTYSLAYVLPNVATGADFLVDDISLTVRVCDADGDGIANYLDTDSDNDGCPDAREGDAGFGSADVGSNEQLLGDVDANGVPVIATASGQGIGSSQDASVESCTTSEEGEPAVLDFDGIDDRVVVPGGTATVLGSECTISGWVYPRNTTPGFPDFDGFFGWRNNSDADFYILQLSATRVEARFRNSSGAFFTIIADVLTLNEWQHFALTYDGTSLVLYRNGIVAGSTSANGSLVNGSVDFELGNLSFGSTNYYFNGQLDEVRCWNYARTEAQITESFDCEIDGTEEGLELYFNFNQGIAGGDNTSETTLPDQGPLGNDGNLEGFALTGTTSNWVVGQDLASCSSEGNEGSVANALDFDGIDDRAVAPGGPTSNLVNECTIYGWVYPRNAAPAFPDFDAFFGWRNETDADFYILQLSATQVEARFRNSAGQAFSIVADGLTLNEWQNFALTYNGSSLILYRNGIVIGSTAANGSLISGSNDFELGSLTFSGNTFYLDGQLDEVACWAYARSEAQIVENLNCELSGTEKGLEIYYNFNQGTSGGDNTGETTLADQSPNGNDVTLEGFDFEGSGSNFVAGQELENCPAEIVTTEGNALDLDGINDRVIAPGGTATVIGNACTIGGWVYPRNGSAVFPDFDGFFGWRNNVDADFYILQTGANQIEARFRNSEGVAFDIVADALTLNEWQYFTLTYDGTILVLYRNGVAIGRTGATGGLVNGSVDFEVGSLSFGGTTFYLDGQVDEVVCWGYARSEAQIIESFGCELNGDEEGLELYYNFNQGIPGGDNSGQTILRDQSPAGNNGTLEGFALNGASSNWVGGQDFPSCTDAAAIAGSALDFDGQGDYVELPANLLSSAESFSFQAMVYLEGEGVWQRIMDFGRNTTVNMFLTPISGDGNPRFAITTAGIGGEHRILAPAPFPRETWTNIAVVIDGGANTGTLYINGTVVAQNTSMTLSPSDLGNLTNYWLGKSQYPDPFLDGRLDEVRIWNRALTEEEISASLDCEVSGSESGLLAYYNFNQGIAEGVNASQTTLLDQSGNGNDGTLTGFALAGAVSNFVEGQELPECTELAGGAFFVVSEESSSPGATVTVPISVNTFTDIATYQGTITFDPSVLTFVSATNVLGAGTSNFGQPGTGDVPANSITFSWFDIDRATFPDGTPAMELVFTVSPDAEYGFTPVEINGSATLLGYSTEFGARELIDPTVEQGGVSIDATVPTIDIVSITSSNPDPGLATVGDVITLSFTTSEEPAQLPTVSIPQGGSGVLTVSGSGTSYTATKVVATGSDGLVTFSISIEDISGNTSTATETTDGSQVIVDTEAPLINCPDDIVVDNEPGTCGAVVGFGVGTSDATVVQTAGPLSGSTFPVGTTTVTFTATDAAGNTSTCDLSITVVDSEPPTVLTRDITVELGADGTATITAADIDAGSSDTCGITALFLDIDSFDCEDIGINTVVLTATDAKGNAAGASATVSVVDNTPPTVLTRDVTVFLDSTGNASITVDDINNGSFDACGIDSLGLSLDRDSFTCEDLGDNIVFLSATDIFGNGVAVSANVTVLDEIPPVVIAQDITVQLDASGTAIITAEQVDNGSSDICGIAALGLDIDAFTCEEVGENLVTLSVTDVNGNSATTTAIVTVVADPVIDISGRAFTELGEEVPNVVWDITGDDGGGSQVGNGFLFAVSPCGSVNDIGGFRDDDAAGNNGVDVQDAFDIVKHVLLIEQLQTPYKLIAADVNATQDLNVLDVFQVMRKVTNITSFFTDPITGEEDAIWTFIPNNFVFDDPRNPWFFETRRQVDDPSGDVSGLDFIGVKFGDVNNSWDLFPARLATPSQNLSLLIDQIAVAPGETVSVPVRVKDFSDMTGYQFTLNWDASVLELQSVNNAALEGIFGTESAKQGRLTTAWVDMTGQAISLQDGTAVFELVFKAKGAIGQEASLEVTSDITPAKAFDLYNNRIGVEFEANSVVVSSTTHIDSWAHDGYSFSQNVPNPFEGSTNLVFSLGKAEKVSMKIYNLNGQVVRSFNGNFPAGRNEITWDGTSENGTQLSQGIYIARLRAGEYSDVIRLSKH